MSTTTDGQISAGTVDRALVAFGALSKQGPGHEMEAMKRALKAADLLNHNLPVARAQLHDALDAYRAHYDLANPARTMRKVLEAARRDERGHEKNQPEAGRKYTGRSYRAEAWGNTPEELEADALRKAEDRCFGHQRLELFKTYLMMDAEVRRDLGRLRADITVRELAGDADA